MIPHLDKDEAGAGGAAIPTRDQIKLEDTWDLRVLYATPEKWSEAFVELQRIYPESAKFQGHVGDSAQSLRDCLEFEKTLSLLIERLGHYASLRSTEDSSDAANLGREGQFDNLMTLIGEATAFIAPEIMAIDDARFEQFLADPVL
ncbi:MAG: pepF1, partial [Chthoniobacteraceae bacterium]|nr:pepF1 [Chthoniobacteraceae bacterium]